MTQSHRLFRKPISFNACIINHEPKTGETVHDI